MLQQLRETYVPLVYKRSLFRGWKKLRLLMVADSSLANRPGKYAQGGLLIFLCEDRGQELGGPVFLVYFLSRKSRRVGTSSKHCETLAMTVGTERCSMLQVVYYEMGNAVKHARELFRHPQ